MKRILILTGCFFAITCVCFAQDVIVTRDFNRIDAIVTEVNADNVRYKHFNNPNGSTYMLRKSDIVSIQYQNGKVETFVTDPRATTSTRAQPQTQRPTQQYQPQTQSSTQQNQYQTQSQSQRTTQQNQYQPQTQRSTQQSQISQYQDVVYLRNGSVIRGEIIEQVPNRSIKIETTDGNIFVFQMVEIENISKIPLQTQSTVQSNQYRPRSTRTPSAPIIDDPVLNNLYRSGQQRTARGWAFIGSGLLLNVVGIGLIVDGATNYYSVKEDQIRAGYAMMLVGDVFFTVGIPTAIGGKVRRVKAMNAYQQRNHYGESKTDTHLRLNLHTNGLGLAYVF